MTRGAVIEEGIDTEAAQERLKAILSRTDEANVGMGIAPAEQAKPAKKTRSDKGTKRPTKPEAVMAGVLVETQAAHIDKLVQSMIEARKQVTEQSRDLADAEAEHRSAVAKYYAYLAELQGK